MRNSILRIVIFVFIILYASNSYAHIGGGILELSIYAFYYLLWFVIIPISIGIFSSIPKFIILTKKINTNPLLNEKVITKEIIKDILLITVIFYFSFSISENFSLNTISFSTTISTTISQILFKIYMKDSHLFSFFLFIIFSLPAYFIVISLIQRKYLFLPGNKITGSINAISVPVTACILIIIYSLIGAPKTPSRYFVDNYRGLDMMLINASYSGIPNLTEALIKSGADVNFNSEKGYTPLFASFAPGVLSYGDRYNTAKVLIKYGADVNARDEKGNPAIVELAKRKQIDLLILLIESGADVTAQNKNGKIYKDYVKTDIEALIKITAHKNN